MGVSGVAEVRQQLREGRHRQAGNSSVTHEGDVLPLHSSRRTRSSLVSKPMCCMKGATESGLELKQLRQQAKRYPI